MADESPKSKVWLTVRGEGGDVREVFNSLATTCQEAVDQLGRLFARHPASDSLTVVSFTWRLSVESPNDESDVSGDLS